MISVYQGKPGEGMTFPRNRAAWMSIADFLTHQNLRLVLKARSAEGAPACGEGSARSAEVHSIPVGNHGEIVSTGRDL